MAVRPLGLQLLLSMAVLLVLASAQLPRRPASVLEVSGRTVPAELARLVEASSVSNPFATFSIDEQTLNEWQWRVEPEDMEPHGADESVEGRARDERPEALRLKEKLSVLSASEAELQPAFSDEVVLSARLAGAIDWVTKGAVNPAVSQGRCGTCAQFSAVADVEAQWYLHGHPLIKLSEQEMIDCASYTGPYGMGWVAAVQKGIASNADYPLANHSIKNITGCRSPCNKREEALSSARIDGATCLPERIHDNETQMLAWLQQGPLSVSIAASPLNGYKGGIITNCNNTHVDHAVNIVGFGTDLDSGLVYWRLRNSWGPAFGENGYFRMLHGVNCLGLRGACQAYIGKAPSLTQS